MLDFAEWTKRVSAFLRHLTRLPGKIIISDSIEPRGDSDFDREWLQSADGDLPDEIRRYIEIASARCVFHYEWTPQADLRKTMCELLGDRASLRGGGDLCELAKYGVSARGGGLGSFLGPDYCKPDSVALEKQQARVPIMEFQKCRAISLGPIGGERRTVVYVEKIGDAASRLLSKSFEQFLLDWEMTCYWDPEVDCLAQWIDPSTGQFKPNPEKCRALRRLLLRE
jgi:hypothetical protein